MKKSTIFYSLGALLVLGSAVILTGCGAIFPVETAPGDPTIQPAANNPPTATAFQAATAVPTGQDQPTATTAPDEAVQPTPAEGSEDVTSLPDPAGYTWTTAAEGLNQPIGLTTAGDGSGWLYVIEQPGRIRIIENDQLITNPFLDIRDRVGSQGSEQGLLGLAFHPEYQENGYFFVNYTDQNGDTVVSRFQVTDDPDQADPGSETVVLTLKQPYRNHNGGQVSFGPDGYLWIGTGDGGSAGDPQNNAQNTEVLLGKLLRIDVDQLPYTLPNDNPFGNEIWAFGLRNPWRFVHDPATGELYIADVGQNQWEEINYLPADAEPGANFGWNYREGAHPFEGTPPEGAELIDPVAEYSHPTGCSVSGGAVYRGAMPAWQGVYLYADYCSGLVWGLVQDADGNWQNQILFRTDRRIPAISQDEAGEVYLLDIRGAVLRLEAN